jgi:nitrogen-specific signal transduction histidine kinase
MKNKYNTLSKYIFEYSDKEYRKETIEGLFRAITEPVVSNQKIESCVLVRLKDISSFDSVLKRLKFSTSNLLSYSADFEENLCNEEIWNDTEFIVVLSQRYSAALIWDYSYSSNKDFSNICLLYNSKIITEIAKLILNNSKRDFKDLLTKYCPDRRENVTLNNSVNIIASLLNEKNLELIFSEKEKQQINNGDEILQTAEIVADKAKFIAHEIKNNLSIINLYSKILQKRVENVNAEGEISESINNSLKNITTASENVSSLISDLRCLSAPYITEISLKEFISATTELCKEKAKKANVNILTEDFEDITVHTDRVKLQCALTNIIFNGIEACRENCKINIEVNKTDKNIYIKVKNNGKMIPEELQNKIFDANFTTKETGNGLGLAICKKEMKLINGDIELEYSDENETSFNIILPI